MKSEIRIKKKHSFTLCSLLNFSRLNSIRYYPIMMNITKHFIPDLKVISVLGSPEELPLKLSINHPEWQRDDYKIWSLDQAYFASLNETFLPSVSSN